jgi:replicative DNA helicase
VDDRPLPADISAERAVLGSILLDRDAIIAIAPWLQPAAFMLQKHAMVYEACLACYRRQEPPDLLTVSSELRRQGQLDLVGGLSFLGEFAAEVPTAVHVEYYARNVEQAALRRRLIETSGRIRALGYDEGSDLDEVAATSQSLISEALQRTVAGVAEPVSTVLDAIMRDLDDGVPPGHPTGLADLDRLTGGFYDGDLVILAARPGMGKTALASQMALHTATAGGRTLFFSLEMPRKQLVQRMLSMRSGVNLQRIRDRQMSESQMVSVMEAASQINDLPLFLDDRERASQGRTMAGLRLAALRLAAERGGLALLVIDFLQMVEGPPVYRGNRTQEISAVSRDLKALAKELRCPIIALSQLSRAVESRPSRVPQLSDLRDSGDIEAAADLVLLLYREDYYDTQTAKPGVAELHVAKHRNGPTGMVPLAFAAETTRFGNLARGSQGR